MGTALEVSTAKQAALKDDPAGLIHLVHWHWAGGVNWPNITYMSEHRVRVLGQEYTDRILSVGDITKNVSKEIDQSSHTGDITLEISNVPEDGEDDCWFSKWLHNPDGVGMGQQHTPPERSVVIIYQTVRRSDGSIVPPELDKHTFRGVLEEVSDFDDQRVVVRIVDEGRFYDRRTLLLAVNKDDVPTAPAAAVGMVLPLLVGSPFEVPLIPLDVGWIAQLVEDIDATQTTIKLHGDDLDLIKKKDCFMVDGELFRVTDVGIYTAGIDSKVTVTVERHKAWKTGELPPGYPDPSATVAAPHRGGADAILVGTWDPFTSKVKRRTEGFVYGCASIRLPDFGPTGDPPIYSVSINAEGRYLQIPRISDIDFTTVNWTYRREDTRYELFDGRATGFHPSSITFEHRFLKWKGAVLKPDHTHADNFTPDKGSLGVGGTASGDKTTITIRPTGGTLGAGGRDGRPTTNASIAVNSSATVTFPPLVDYGTVTAVRFIATLGTANSTECDVGWDDAGGSIHGTDGTGAFSITGEFVFTASAPTDNWNVNVTLTCPVAASTALLVYDCKAEVEYTMAVDASGLNVTGDPGLTGGVSATDNHEIVANEFVQVMIGLAASANYQGTIHNDSTDGRYFRFNGMANLLHTPVHMLVYVAHERAGIPIDRIHADSINATYARQLSPRGPGHGNYLFHGSIVDQITFGDLRSRIATQSRTQSTWENGQLKARFQEMPGYILSRPPDHTLTEKDLAGDRRVPRMARMKMSQLLVKAEPFFDQSFRRERRGGFHPRYRQPSFKQGETLTAAYNDDPASELLSVMGTAELDIDKFHWDLIGQTLLPMAMPDMAEDVGSYYVAHFGGVKQLCYFDTTIHTLEGTSGGRKLERGDIIALAIRLRLPNRRQIWFNRLDGSNRAYFKLIDVVEGSQSGLVKLVLFQIKRTSVVGVDPAFT